MVKQTISTIGKITSDTGGRSFVILCDGPYTARSRHRATGSPVNHGQYQPCRMAFEQWKCSFRRTVSGREDRNILQVSEVYQNGDYKGTVTCPCDYVVFVFQDDKTWTTTRALSFVDTE